jgi:hypothetical protein
MPQAAGFSFGLAEDRPCSFRESLERRRIKREPLVSRLLADAESTADLRPRMSGAAALANEVAEKRVANLFEVTDGLRRLGQLEQGLVTWCIGPNAVDQFLQGRRWSHSSTLH